MPRPLLITLIATALLAMFATSGAAQTPQVGQCVIPPVTLPLFDATPAAMVAATPQAATGPATPGDGEIEQAVADLVDCINTGDPAFVYAVFTERYLASLFADPAAAYQPELEQQIANGALSTPDTFTLVAISGITPLDDGRVSVTITLANGVSEFRDTLTLALVDGTWRIDDVTGLDPPR